MRAIASGAITRLENGQAAARNAVWFDVGAGYGVWDDIWDTVISSRTYVGQAGRFTITPTPSVSDGSIQSVEIVFSGVDPTIYPFVTNEAWHQQPMEISRLIMNPVTSAIDDVRVWFAGFIDAIYIREAANGQTVLGVRCESVSRDIERKGTATRSEASQRRINANDGFFKYVAQMPVKEIYWGRNPPAPPKGKLGKGGEGGYSA